MMVVGEKFSVTSVQSLGESEHCLLYRRLSIKALNFSSVISIQKLDSEAQWFQSSFFTQ